MSSTPVEKKVAIVTGGTSGIGKDLAKDLIAQGYLVAIVGRRSELGEQVAQQLGASARFFQADVSDYDSQAAMFRSVWSAYGRIDALCANAGIVDKSSVYLLNWRNKSPDDVPPKPDLQTTDVNYKGVVYGTMLATHFMRHNPTPGGKIVITGSIGAFFPHRAYPEYCGTKAAVVQFIRGVAPILKEKDNITINGVHPGLVMTDIIPEAMVLSAAPEHRTPTETVVKGYRVFLDDETGITGKNVEASGTSLHYYDAPEMQNGAVTLRSVTVWEPGFVALHEANSGLPDAVL